MITVTDDAKALLDRMRDDALSSAPAGTPQDEQCLRIVAQDDVFGVGIDSPRDGDQVVDYNGRPLLLIGPDIDQMLDGATIDTRQTPDGEKLTLSRAHPA